LQIDYTAKSSYDLFLLQYRKATTTVNPCTGLYPQSVIAGIRTT